ncbi:MAG: hypothetical protein ACQETL_06995, partial [Bacteroidota bacterium]
GMGLLLLLLLLLFAKIPNKIYAKFVAVKIYFSKDIERGQFKFSGVFRSITFAKYIFKKMMVESSGFKNLNCLKMTIGALDYFSKIKPVTL